MIVEDVRVRLPNGKTKIVTKVETDRHTTVIFNEKLTPEAAVEKVRKYERNPKSFHGVRASVEKYKEFNWKLPRTLKEKLLPLDVPFVRIGPVPVITYLSRKEGKLKAYKHETKKMPILYMHPNQPVGLLLGGSLKVKDWLYD